MTTFLFYVSKLFRVTLASPLFVCLSLAVAALFALKARSRVARVLKAAALTACFTVAPFSTGAVAKTLAGAWELPLGSAQAIAATGPFDAIVTLGGTISPVTSTPEQPQLGDAAERLTGTALLYRQGAAPIVLWTGGTGDIAFPDKPEAPAAVALLELMGIPAAAIVLESASRNTYENAVLSKPILDGLGAKRVILITSAWHLRRSAAIFRKLGYDFTPYAVDSLTGPFAFPADLCPDASALDLSTRILREMIGVVAYRLLGRL